MPESTPQSSGRFIRFALVGFPVGLIITSILSFGIWWQKKQSVAERSVAHAKALRREMTLPALERYTRILQEVMQTQGMERLSAVSSFVDSSMSAENMGYKPRRDRFFHGSVEVSNVDVELTGTQRPREVLLVLVPFGDAARVEPEIQALAGLMALGHALAGDRKESTLRLAATPLDVKDAAGRTALERLAAAVMERQERLMKVLVLGGVGEPVLEQVRQVFQSAQTGTVVESLPATATAAETLKAMSDLKTRF